MKIQKLALFLTIFGILHAPAYGFEDTTVESQEKNNKPISKKIGAAIGIAAGIVTVVSFIVWKRKKPQPTLSKIDLQLLAWKKAIKTENPQDITSEEQLDFLEILNQTLAKMPAMNLVSGPYSTILAHGIRTGTIPISKELFAVIVLHTPNLFDNEMVQILFQTNKLTIDMLPKNVVDEIKNRKSTKLSDLNSNQLLTYADIMRSMNNKGGATS